jgi:hypothetical protein
VGPSTASKRFAFCKVRPASLPSLRGFELRDGSDDDDRGPGHDWKGSYGVMLGVPGFFGLLGPIRCPSVAQVRDTWRHEVTSDGRSAMSRIHRRSPGSWEVVVEIGHDAKTTPPLSVSYR